MQSPTGFTLIQLLIVVAILGILSAIVLLAVNPAKMIDEARFSRVEGQFASFTRALDAYLLNNNNVYPADVDRGIPPELIDVLKNENWPHTPWGEPTTYDWDNIIDPYTGEHYVQIGIRFCALNNASHCNFPNLEWAKDFDYRSSAYYCIKGPCKAHKDSAPDHPAYCANCEPGKFHLD